MLKSAKWTLVLGALVVVALALSGCAASAPEIEDEWGVAVFKPGEKVRVGGAMTLSGDYAVLGENIQMGMNLAVADEFRHIHGFGVDFVFEDSMCSGEGGAAVCNKFAADPSIVAVMGHMCTPSNVPCLSVYEKAGIPMVSASATAAQLTAVCGPVFNRVAFNDNKQGEGAVAYMKDTLGLTKIAVIHDSEPYGQGLADYVNEAWQEAGLTVTDYEGITQGDTDFRAVLTKIATNEPEGIYFGGFFTEAAFLVQQKNEVGLEDTILFSDDGTLTNAFIEAAGEAAEGNYATSVAETLTEEMEDFKARHLEVYGVAHDELGPFAASAYDATYVILHALQEVSVKGTDGNLYVPRKALADAIRGTDGLPLLGGTTTCDECGDCAAASPQFNVVKDGEWVAVE